MLFIEKYYSGVRAGIEPTTLEWSSCTYMIHISCLVLNFSSIRINPHHNVLHASKVGENTESDQRMFTSGGDRTHNLPVTCRVLYLLSYRGSHTLIRLYGVVTLGITNYHRWWYSCSFPKQYSAFLQKLQKYWKNDDSGCSSLWWNPWYLSMRS